MWRYSGFESTARANALAQKVVANDIALRVTQTFYSPINCQSLVAVVFILIFGANVCSSMASEGAFLNDTEFPLSHNYITPPAPFTVNGVSDPTSQRFHVSDNIHQWKRALSLPVFRMFALLSR